MGSVKEYIGVWKEQYFPMVRIQFPEFLRSASLLIYAFVSKLPVNKISQQPIGITSHNHEYEDKIECEVLYDPPPGTRRGDVIIIHGLHGSTYKTWRQGDYKNEVQKIQLRRNLSVSSTSSSKQICSKCKLVQRKTSRDNEINESIDSVTMLNESSMIDSEIYNYNSDCDSEQFNPTITCDSNLDDNINIINFLCDNNNLNWSEDGNQETIPIPSQDMDDMDVYQEDVIRINEEDSCMCDGSGMNNETFLNEFNISEQRLKYQEIYGNGPLIITRLIFFFVKFMVNLIKEIYSLYKRMLNNSEENLSHCWPRDWLPMDCPYTRVISINYTTFLWMPFWTKSCNRTSLEEKSLEMARQLENLGVGNYPVLWAAHSKGGLFIKQIFIDSWKRRDGLSGKLYSNTNTIVFYSVPQHGSVLAYLFTSPFVKPSVEIVEVRAGSPMLLRLNYEFIEALKASSEYRKSKAPPDVISYTETIPTNMNGVLIQIVFPPTADPGVGVLYGIPLDHRMICKFASRDSELYKDLVQLIEQTCNSDLTS